MDLPVSYNDVFSVKEHNFNEMALTIFQFQATNNAVYVEYLQHLGISPSQITCVEDIPHLPIEFFKSHIVKTGNWDHSADQMFESSSTTGSNTSKHYYHDIAWYRTSYQKYFEAHYGSPDNWCILALLPNYLERSNSSLIEMTHTLIQKSKHPRSGFYLYNHQDLIDNIKKNESDKTKTLLIGVSYALLDFSAEITGPFEYLTVMETGGMKGRKKEMIRQDLHKELRAGFGPIPIHSEYGMTELFSQAYSQSDHLFECPSWMKVNVKQLDDPFTNASFGRNGLINVIDLANIQTCSFIATSDIGRLHKDGRFEVLGRFDHSEQRGCNLLLA